MRIHLKHLILILILFPLRSPAQSLPTGHWVYASIRKLQILGNFENLSTGSLPYSRLDIAKELVILAESHDTLPNLQHPELELLIREFRTEIKFLETYPPPNTIESLYTQIDISSTSATSRKHESKMSVRTSFNVHSPINLQYGAVLDQSLINSSEYMGYEWRGFTGYQDQLFIQFKSQYAKVLLGREYIKWGYGHTGNLFISDNSRPFDMIKVIINSSLFRLEYFTAQLDQMYGSERYLSATRISFIPRKNIFLGLGQSALYGGTDKSVDFTLSNPLSFYSFSQDNDSKNMNGMLYADIMIRIIPGINVYGELLIDDFQVDSEEKSDLEPNEIAFILGVEGVQVIGFLDVWMEFAQVRNRTYNVPEGRPFEKFLHRGKPIAHHLGTDFQLLATKVETWFKPTLKGYVDISFSRKGEGTITGSFSEPWLDDTVNLISGYTEKIPFGIIESTFDTSIGVIWHPTNYLSVEASVSSQNSQNVEHIQGADLNSTVAQLYFVSEFDGFTLLR
ncbi:MAG: hypothetical protein HOD37_04780 [Bacteroidetes bacterium]|nr:hypothetical protein [Bacteroidota bacterium]